MTTFYFTLSQNVTKGIIKLVSEVFLSKFLQENCILNLCNEVKIVLHIAEKYG